MATIFDSISSVKNKLHPSLGVFASFAAPLTSIGPDITLALDCLPLEVGGWFVHWICTPGSFLLFGLSSQALKTCSFSGSWKSSFQCSWPTCSTFAFCDTVENFHLGQSPAEHCHFQQLRYQCHRYLHCQSREKYPRFLNLIHHLSHHIAHLNHILHHQSLPKFVLEFILLKYTV